MPNYQHSYENDVIKVSFNGRICAHAGYCFRELREVFDGARNPPIKLEGGTTEEIIRVVELCPSSALTYHRLDDGQNEKPAEEATAALIANGPLALRGDLTLGDKTYPRLTLCRCGKSREKPFCDASHKRHNFDDEKTTAAEDITDDQKLESVTLNPSPNGPILFEGKITFKTKESGNICSREKGAICRCGESNNKPFCDGTHGTIDFKAP